MHKYLFFIFFWLTASPTFANFTSDKFVYLRDMDPTIQQEMRYAGNHNFIGRTIKGYETAECILTKEAATALADIQNKLQTLSLSLKVYDCYRPQMAVDDFISWSKDSSQQKMKNEFYPNVNKADVFKLGYVAEKSGHTRGSTIDLTIVTLPDYQNIDMGTTWDFMDVKSHGDNKEISEQAYQHRKFLKSLMESYGFSSYPYEWWHFTLKNEPFADTYFNFPIKHASKNKKIAADLSQQMLLVLTDTKNSFRGTLKRLERKNGHEPWKMIGKPIPVVLGKNGIAAGGVDKKEGDLKTPAGIYSIKTTFGFSNTAPGISLPYYPITNQTECVDDASSKFYNQIVDRNNVTNVDWKSSEKMQTIPQYQLGAVIAYNTVNPTPSTGSCIFLHSWKDDKTGTAGCIAMNEKDLKTVLGWLNTKKKPQIKIMSK